MMAKASLVPFAVGVSAAIFNEQGHVLLVKHTYMRGWQLPNGGVNRGEPVLEAVMREMREEVGLAGGSAELMGVYTRKSGWATNIVVLFRIIGGEVRFKPNWEIREICFADPSAPPSDCTDGTLRRLKEIAGTIRPAPYW